MTTQSNRTASECRQIASAFPVTANAELKVIGQGTNPARKGSNIFATWTSAFRTDTLEDSRAEVALQLKYIPAPLQSMVKENAELLAAALFQWKQNVTSFVQKQCPSCVVGVRGSKALSPELFITQMDRGGKSAKELLECAEMSLRVVLLQWVTALKDLEVDHGLTYADPHLDNFLLFGDTWKLVDLESLQPWSGVFDDSAETRDSKVAVPCAFALFLDGYHDPVARATLRKFFRSAFCHKLERYLIRDTKALLQTARKHGGPDTDEDLLAVEQFIDTAAGPMVHELKNGRVQPDKFFRTLFAAMPTTLITPSPSTGAHHQAPVNSRKQMHCGDIAKLLIVVMCLGFLACIALHEIGAVRWFSRSYLTDGFCIPNQDQHPALQGHALSFYADALLAVWMYLMVRFGREYGLSEPALRPVSKNAVSLFGHGCGHLFLAVMSASSAVGAIFESVRDSSGVSGGLLSCAAFVALMPVWWTFMRDQSRSTATTLAFTLMHNTLQVFFLPTRFFFTHVLMAVLLGSALRWLSRPATMKNKYYAMESWLVDVPILLASFGEALTCDSVLMKYGGHVWFDVVVPVGFTVYMAILLLTGDGGERASKKRL